jgi:hypothetical protein
MLEHGLLTYLVLQRRDESNEIDGVAAYWTRSNFMTPPIVGYDMTKPQDLGLYRMVSLMYCLEGRRIEANVNMSGGVSSFKRSRGAKSITEFSAVYFDHLPFYRRIPFHFMISITQLVLKIIELKRKEL